MANKPVKSIPAAYIETYDAPRLRRRKANFCGVHGKGLFFIVIFRSLCYNSRMVNFNEKMPRERARAINAVVLAFVGDAAYSLFVREGLVFGHDYKTGTLQKLAAARVSAKGQAAVLERVFSRLTDEERDIFLRGRNAKKPTKSKNASVAEYNVSTGFEAVIGFLYLVGDYERIGELLAGENE